MRGLQHLLTLQNMDGGWGWWQKDESDTYITAYVLFGLAKAREAGLTLPAEAINKASSYLSTNLSSPNLTTEAWKLDRLAFELFALKQSGQVNLASANSLYKLRDQLSPWAKAMLTLSLNLLSSASDQVPTLISDLQSTAIRSATGVHWEADHPDWRNMTSPLQLGHGGIYPGTSGASVYSPPGCSQLLDVQPRGYRLLELKLRECLDPAGDE